MACSVRSDRRFVRCRGCLGWRLLIGWSLRFDPGVVWRRRWCLHYRILPTDRWRKRATVVQLNAVNQWVEHLAGFFDMGPTFIWSDQRGVDAQRVGGSDAPRQPDVSYPKRAAGQFPISGKKLTWFPALSFERLVSETRCLTGSRQATEKAARAVCTRLPQPAEDATGGCAFRPCSTRRTPRCQA